MVMAEAAHKIEPQIDTKVQAIPAGYKYTEIGVIPEDWEVSPLRDLCRQISDGTHFTPRYANIGIAFYSVENITSGDFEDTKFITPEEHRKLIQRCKPERGDILMTRITAGVLGDTKFIDWDVDASIYVSLALLKMNKIVSPEYIYQYSKSQTFRDSVEKRGLVNATPKKINMGEIGAIPIPAPTCLREQEAIAEALSDTAVLIEGLEQLIAKKRAIKQGAMQELLTGKTRLPGFTGEWTKTYIAKIAAPSTERNNHAQILPVLTCSKHLGFVDSLTYFKNQVFSGDTRGYKVIRRGQIGYPSNHIEEGSIGLQDIYDIAIVSPIYVVFSAIEGTNSYFLHRLLKLDAYRKKFETGTTASVARRGSLRWPAFSQIEVALPGPEEQSKIATILSDMDAEIAVLQAKLTKARAIKQGMMQELLTGRVRLV